MKAAIQVPAIVSYAYGVDDQTFPFSLTAGVIILLLAFSSWHGAWWRAKAAPARPSYSVASSSASRNPFAPRAEFIPQPVVAAAIEPPLAAAPPPPRIAATAQTLPEVEPREMSEEEAVADQAVIPDVDFDALVKRNRTGGRGTRSH